MHQALSPLLASSAVTVDLDPTMFIHFILFAAFVWFMKDLIFDPLMKVFETREERTQGAIGQAREMDEEALALKQEHDSKLEEIRRDAAVDRERIRAEVKKLESELMSEARDAVGKTLEAGLAKIRGEVDAIRGDLDAQQGKLASEIASKVLGRRVDS